MKKTIIVLLMLSFYSSYSQDDEWSDFESSGKEVKELFHDTRVLNGHSVETLEKRTLDFRVVHRFGDAAVSGAGRTLFGLDNSTDIKIGFEYGITDNLMIGAGRSKGSGPYSELWDGFVKYNIFSQGDKFPISLSITTGAFYTSMKESLDPSSVASFQKSSHRLMYNSQLLIGRQFFDLITLQLSPTYLHRNYVAFGDVNGLYSLGASFKLKLMKKVSLLGEYFYNLNDRSEMITEYSSPLSFGVEFKTYSHVFQLCFMNSRGIGEAQFIPYTSAVWGEGQFRFGFTISRHFNL